MYFNTIYYADAERNLDAVFSLFLIFSFVHKNQLAVHRGSLKFFHIFVIYDHHQRLISLAPAIGYGAIHGNLD